MDNLAWGLQITVLGMGLVFALLALLWGLLALLLRLDKPPAAPSASPEAMPVTVPALAVASTAPGEAGTSAAMVAAIALAISLHRARQHGVAEVQTRVHMPGSLLHASRWVAAGRQRQTRSWRRGG